MDTASEKHNGTLRNRTLTSVFWRFAERLSSHTVSFVVSIVIARILLPEQFGVVAFTLVFISVADALTSSGFGSALIQRDKIDKTDIHTMFTSGLALSFTLYLILFIFAPIIASYYETPLLSPVLRVMGLKLPISAFNSIQQALVSRELKFKRFFFSTLTGTMISGIIGISMALVGFGVWALVAQHIANILVNTLALNFIVKWRPQIQFSSSSFNNLFPFAWKIMVTGVISSFFLQLQNFVIGAKFTPTDLAYYNRGVHIPAIIANNLGSSIESVLFAVLSKLQNNNDRVRAALRKTLQTSSFVIFPFMFIILASSDKLVTVVLTEKWLPCVPYMQLACISQCFNFLNTANLQAIKAIGRSDIVLRLEFIKKPLLIVAIIIGMQFGALAIAVAWTIYSAIALLINSYPNIRLFHYGLVEQFMDVAQSLTISVAVCILVYLVGTLSVNIYILLFCQFAVGFFVYFLISHLTNSSSYNMVRSVVADFIQNKIRK